MQTTRTITRIPTNDQLTPLQRAHARENMLAILLETEPEVGTREGWRTWSRAQLADARARAILAALGHDR